MNEFNEGKTKVIYLKYYKNLWFFSSFAFWGGRLGSNAINIERSKKNVDSGQSKDVFIEKGFVSL
jgi:hypothetical protein